jgi:hypothetical protein
MLFIGQIVESLNQRFQVSCFWNTHYNLIEEVTYFQMKMKI